MMLNIILFLYSFWLFLINSHVPSLQIHWIELNKKYLGTSGGVYMYFKIQYEFIYPIFL